LNHGTTWKTLTGVQVNSLAFDPAEPGSFFLALEYDGVAKSRNGGENVDLVNNGFVDRVISSVTTSGNNLVALEPQEGETSGIFLSSDHGETWFQMRNTKGLAGVHLKTIAGMSSEERILLAASPRQMYKSIDAGLTWKTIPVRLIVKPPPEAARPKAPPVRAAQRGKRVAARPVRTVTPKPITRDLAFSEIDGLYTIKSGTKDFVFAATNLGLLRSDDMGEHWTFAEITGSSAVTALYASPSADGCLIARGAGGLYSSKDYGDHWTELPFPIPVSDVNDIAVPPIDGAPLLVATRVGLFSSPDAGAHWYPSRTGLPASTVNSVLYAGSEQTAYAVEYGRLYQTSDGGNSWSEIPTALPSLRIRQLWMPDNKSSRLFGITNDLGIIFRN
jgi:photosystem II stability/assembly factor-like uncharacterized protein